MSHQARITAIGTYLPEEVLTNADIEKLVDTSDEWIVTRSGIRERRIASDDQAASDIALPAAKQALEKAGLDAKELDAIILATMTPDYISPSTAAILQHNLGAENAAAFDISAACTGYLYGLSIARAYIESGVYQNVLVVCAEKLSAFTNYKDRSTCFIFGDGAAASVVQNKGPGLALKEVLLGADGSQAELIAIPGGGSRHPATEQTLGSDKHLIHMIGNEVFKHAVRRMQACAIQCLEKTGLKESDIAWLVPHQANIRIMDALAKRFEIPNERLYKTIHKYGNTSACTIPISLSELIDSEPVKTGEHILLIAFGAGLTFGAGILTKVD